MRLNTTLDRHVFREVLVPSVMAFVVYTLLLMMNGLFTLIEQVVVFGVSFRDAMSILTISVPSIAVITIPVSFLFGVLLAAGRMTADNEITALQAAGVPASRLFRPILVLGILLTIASGFLATKIIPGTHEQMTQLRRKMFSNAAAIGRIQPKVFYDELPGILLYVQNISQETGHWRNVLIHRAISPNEQQLTLARRGRLVTTTADISSSISLDPSGAGFNAKDSSSNLDPESWILLEDVVNHTFHRDRPEKFQTSTVQTHLFRPFPENDGSTTVTYHRSLKERSTTELWSYTREGRFEDGDPVDDKADEAKRIEQAQYVGIELHQRYAIPLACTTFALLALPLGIGARAGGRGRGFLFSILVVMAYFILNSYGEYLVLEHGLPPAVGGWLPNFAIVVMAWILSRRMGRWLGERQRPEGWLSKLMSELKRRRLERRKARGKTLSDSTPTSGFLVVGGASRRRTGYGGGFPTLLDRYLTRRMLVPLALVVLSTVALYIVGDLTSRMDDLAKTKVGADVILGYYWSTIPRAVFDVFPFAVLISVITVLTVLERNHELTALKAAGLSLFRVALPLVMMSILAAGAMLALGERVVPESNRTSWRLLNRIKGHRQVHGFTNDRQWVLGRDGQTYYTFLRFHTRSQTLIRFSMFRVDEEMRLRYQLSSPRVRYDNGSWITDGGWFRNISTSGDDDFRKITRPTELGIPEAPSYFGQEHRQPSEMSMPELGRYIQELKESGYQPRTLVVRWHQKLAIPLSTLVLTLIALPFALNVGGRRASTMQGIAIALGLGIAYFIVMVPLLAKLGEADFLPPAIGAWAPVVIGLLFSINRMTTIKT